MSALMGVLHETGHACYEQNLPPDWVHQPVGAPLSMASHEGQSLFFEMQMSRSFPFFKFSAAIMKKHLFDCCPDEKFWTAQNLYKLNTRVQPGFIRVDADEVTYPGHIILRYEIERDLISGTLNIDDIPHVWDEKMREYLGLSTKNDFKNGCMQDVHWPSGAFGYFPSYTMGAMFAAQMAQAMEKENPQMWTEIERGDFSKVRGWLKNKIWSLGSFYSLDDLLSQATGSTLSAEPFKNHIRKRYLG